MPFCPKCKYEYEENIESCSDCGTKLVDQLEKEPAEEYDNPAFLTNVADEIQASIIISKLSTYDVPVMKNYKESGSFMAVYMGNTIFGIDLYVPSKLLSLAKEALEEDPSDNNDEFEFDSMIDDFGFEDMDNLEFDEDEIDENHEAKDLHLVNIKLKNTEIPNTNDFSNDGKQSSDNLEKINIADNPPNDPDDTADASISHGKKVKKMFTLAFIIILTPTILFILFSLSRLLTGK